MELNFEYSGLPGPYLAAAGVAFLALLAAVRKQKRLKLVADPQLLNRTWLPKDAAAKRVRRELLLWIIIGGLLTAALLRPQWGYVWRDTKRRGVDLIVAVDVSESMLAADILPSRLARARYKIRDLLEHLRGDRVGLVAFAGTAFIESPLTVDYGTFRLFLDSLTPELIPIQGTNIRSALEKSLEALGYQELEHIPETNEGAKSQAIVLITDGEDFEGDFAKLGEFAAANGVQIYIIGIGTKDGGPIPVGKGFKRDRDGKMVVTRLNEDKLVDLAKKTGGIYVQARGSDDDIGTIYDRGIRTFLESRSIEGGRRRLWNERFQVPLLFALALLLFGPWGSAASTLSGRRRKVRDGITKNAPTAPVQSQAILLFISGCFSILLASPAAARADAESSGYQGKQELIAGDFERARSSFSAAVSSLPSSAADPRPYLGLGESYYRLGRFKEAADAYKHAADAAAEAGNGGKKGADELAAAAQYNLGNSLVQTGDYSSAIASYEAAKKIRQTDREISDNLIYARRLLAQLEKKKPQSKKEQAKPAPTPTPEDDQEQKKEQQEKKQDTEQDKNEQQSSEQQKEEEQDPKDKQSEENEQKKDKQDQQKQEKNQDQKDKQANKQEQNKQEQNKQQQQDSGGGKDQKQKQDQSDSNSGQKDKQQGEEDDKQKKSGGSQDKQQTNTSKPSSGDGDSGKDQSQQQQSGGDESGSGRGQEQSKDKHSGENSGDTSQAQGEKEEQPGGQDSNGRSKSAGEKEQAEGGKPDPDQQGKEGSLEQGAGRRSSDPSDNGEKGAGVREGGEESQPGDEEDSKKAGTDSKDPSEQPSVQQRRGTSADNSGTALNSNQYASPLGDDIGQSAGDGAKDKLAQKEGQGDHSGIAGPLGDGGNKDGTGRSGVEAFLENVGEERGNYIKYREKKGLEQLRSEGRSVPEKDW